MVAEVVRQELADIEAYTAGTNNRHSRTNRFVVTEHIEVSEHLGMIDAFNCRCSRLHASGDHHIIKALGLE